MFRFLSGIGKGIQALFSFILKGGTEEVVGRTVFEGLRTLFTGKVTVGKEEAADIRGQWVADMEKIEAGDSARNIPAKPLTNIWQWKEEARTGQLRFSDGKVITENNFVMLLAKIPVAARPTVYPQLDTLFEPEFIQRLDALEHDVVYQTARRWIDSGWPYVLTGWIWGKTATNTWLEAKVQARAHRPIRTRHPFLSALAWGVGVPVVLGTVALIAVFVLA